MGSPYPNPSRGQLYVRFALPVGGPVKLEVYDVSGRLVRQVMNQEVEAGAYQGLTDMSTVNPGIYFYRLTTSHGVLTRPFAIAK